MLSDFHPTDVLLSYWPTGEFELSDDVSELGKRLREQFPRFTHLRRVQVAGSAGPPPPQVPRMILMADQGRWTLELGMQRVMLRRRAPRGGSLSAMLDEIMELSVPLHAWLAENANLRVYRLGLVAQLMYDTHSSASAKIADYFLQPRALQGGAPSEVQVGVHSRLTLGGGMMVNRWVRARPLRTADNRRLDLAAQIEVDLNTMGEDTQVKTGREISTFLEETSRHLLEDLPLIHDPDFLA